MRNIIFTWACIVFAAGWVSAQETNLLKTDIENFEAQTNTVIVRGYGQIGTVPIDGGVISIRNKESIDVTHARKIYGVVIDLNSDSVTRQRAIIDEEEIEALLGGLDYLVKITGDVTAMPAFEAKYVTKSGLAFMAHGSRRQAGIQFYLRFEDNPRFDLNTDQLSQIRNFISQARNGLNALK